MIRGAAPRRHSAGSLSALAVALALCPAGQSSAQSLFDFLFGRSFNTSPSTSEPQPPATVNRRSVVVVNVARKRRSDHAGGAYCVRLCDGRFFPVQRDRNSTRAEICHSLCPASPTKVFLGSEINSAAASDGTRYSELGNAFVYRDRIVPGCTCNGKSSLGLAPIAIDADPTLRAGDAVATADGVKVFTGRSLKGKSAEYASIPIARDQGRLADIRRALAASRWAQANR